MPGTTKSSIEETASGKGMTSENIFARLLPFLPFLSRIMPATGSTMILAIFATISRMRT